MSDLPPGFVLDQPAQNDWSNVPTSGGRPQITINARPNSLPHGFVLDAPTKPGVAEDVTKSIAGGLGRGVAGMAGLPDLMDQGADWIARQTVGRAVNAAKSGGKDWSADQSERVPTGRDYLAFPSTETVKKGIEAVTGPFHEPTTTAGHFASTAAEFVPGTLMGGGSSVVSNALRYGVVPGLASEAAGQATKGTGYEGVARVGGALAGAGGAALFSRPGTASRAIREQLPPGITPQHIDDASALIARAKQQGVDLAWPEALSQVAGRPVMTNLLRHLEASPQTEAKMAEFFGQRPGQIETAGRNAMDGLAPVNNAPSSIGPEISEAARRAMAATPEGRALYNSLWKAGPRTTPGDAGAVIQSELRGVYDRREGMRSALAEGDYAAARNAPADVAMNGDFHIGNVTKHFEPPAPYPIIRGANGQMRKMTPDELAAANLERPVPVHPVTRGPDGKMRRMTGEEVQSENASRWSQIEQGRAQRQTDFNVTEQTPIIGQRATHFEQVNAQPVIAYLDAELNSAKGAVRQGLQAAKNAMLKSNGEIDGSVAGLHSGRMAIKDLMDQAKLAGANNTVRELDGALSRLDDVLEAVPAYGQARRNFKAASEPLKPFDPNNAPGRIIARDKYNERFDLSPEQVPTAIERAGGRGAKDFADVASPAAREAFESHIVTQVLEKARTSGTGLGAEAIRTALRQNEDLLRQFPGVRAKLEAVAASKDALEKVMQSPLGKLANKDKTTKAAIDAVFPANPLPNSAQEISQTVGALANRSPRAAGDLVRAHAESVFNESTQALQSGANQAGGAKFRAVLVGNPQQKANFEAAVKALPNGADRLAGFNNFLEVAEATGTRQGIGSRTAYNADLLKSQGASGLVGEGAKAATNPLKGVQFLADKYERWRLGQNLNELADILTNPAAANQLRAIAKMPPGSRQAEAIALRLVNLTRSSTNTPVGNSK